MELPLDLGMGASIDDTFAEKNEGLFVNLGPFKYYVIKIFTLLAPPNHLNQKANFDFYVIT